MPSINLRTALCFESAFRNLIFVVSFPGGFLAYQRKKKLDELAETAELPADRQAPHNVGTTTTQQPFPFARPGSLLAALHPFHNPARLHPGSTPAAGSALFSSLAECQSSVTPQEEQQRCLTAEIQRATTLQRLLALLTQDPALLNHVHLTAALLQLAALHPPPPSSPPAPSHRTPRAARALAAHITRALLHHQPLHTLPPADLTALLHALAKARCAHPALLHRLAALLRAHAPLALSTTPKLLANAAWALATLRHRDRDLLHQIAAAAAPRAPAFTTQGLATLCWSFATLHHHDHALFAAVSDALLAARPRPRPQEVSMLAWAHARLHPPAPTPHPPRPPHDTRSPTSPHDTRSRAPHQPPPDLGFFAYLAGEAAAQMEHLSVQGLCNLAWALAHVGFQPPDYFRSLAQALAAQPPSAFIPQDVAFAAATFRTHYHAPLYATLSAATAALAPRLPLSTIQLLAAALAGVPHYDRPAFWALGARVLHLRDQLTFADAARLARAFAAVPHADPRLWEALRGAATPAAAAGAPVEEVAGMLWALAAAGEAGRGAEWCLAACQRLASCSPRVLAACAEGVGEGFWSVLAALRAQLRGDGGGAGGEGGLEVDPVLRGQLLGLLDALLGGEAARGHALQQQQRKQRQQGEGGGPRWPSSVQAQQQRLCEALARLGLAPVAGVLEAGGRVRVDVAVHYRGVPVAVLLPRGDEGEARGVLEGRGWAVLEVRQEELEGRLATPEEACLWVSQRLLGLVLGAGGGAHATHDAGEGGDGAGRELVPATQDTVASLVGVGQRRPAGQGPWGSSHRAA